MNYQILRIQSEISHLQSRVRSYCEKSKALAALQREETQAQQASQEPATAAPTPQQPLTAQQVYEKFKAGSGDQWLAEVAPELEAQWKKR